MSFECSLKSIFGLFDVGEKRWPNEDNESVDQFCRELPLRWHVVGSYPCTKQTIVSFIDPSPDLRFIRKFGTKAILSVGWCYTSNATL
jgi:hypothetical protein